MKTPRLLVLETHPVQYHAPVYRHLAQGGEVDVQVIYGSDFSVAGYRDKEFGASFSWDADLLTGVPSSFLSRVAEGGAANYDAVTGAGMLEAARACEPDAILSLGYVHPFDRAAQAVARSLGKPLLFRGETTDHAKARSPLRRWVRDFVLRRLYRQCAALLFVGSRSRAHYQRLGVPEAKLFASPYCVDAAVFRATESDRGLMRAATRAELGIADDAIVLIFSGKLSHRKGVDLIPAAVRLLPQEWRSKVHLLFLGDGALRSELETLCQTAPAVAVSFVGFQNQSKLSAFYHAADALVLPSRAMETWGLVVNEALMHGLPCVVSDSVGSQTDLVIPGLTGEYCVADDAVALGQALTRLLARMSSGVSMASDCRATVARYSVEAASEGIARAMRVIACGLAKEGDASCA